MIKHGRSYVKDMIAMGMGRPICSVTSKLKSLCLFELCLWFINLTINTINKNKDLQMLVGTDVDFVRDFMGRRLCQN